MVESVRDVIDRRLARLSQPCSRVLTLAAFDGTALRPWLLGRVLGDDVDLTVLLEEATVARVLVADDGSQLRFVHDLFCEVLVAELPALARRGAHRDLAVALQAARAEVAVVHPAELASHFGAAAVAGEPSAREPAVRYAREAVADATARLAFEDAVAHLERALSMLDAAPPDPRTRLTLMLATADARRFAGRLRDAADTYRDVFAGARELGDAETTAHAALGLHAVGLKTGPSHEHDNHAALLAATADALSDDATALGARVRATLARTLHHSLDTDQMARAPAVAQQAVALARRSRDPQATADALLALHDSCWRPGAAVQRMTVLDELLAVAPTGPVAEPGPNARLLRAQALLETGDPTSLVEIDRYCSAAERLGDPASR
jgi:hypothetical protein